ncbi:hypothetical protein SDC9_132891 [bioreactor metagenome]|uniref:Uncharacterized protein n=1 Tax=bioreactor metagenome TaxID=1076179 RepID=A0A645D9F7_9ZZZZ
MTNLAMPHLTQAVVWVLEILSLVALLAKILLPGLTQILLMRPILILVTLLKFLNSFLVVVFAKENGGRTIHSI